MPSYLFREGDTFVFRRRVPAHLQSRVGIREIYRSLRTSSRQQARHLAARLFVATEEVFQMAETTTHSDDEIRAAARYWLNSLFGRPYRERLRDMKPGDFAPDIEAVVAEIWADTSAERESQYECDARSAESCEAMDALEFAGFRPRDSRHREAIPPKSNRAATLNPLRGMGSPAREIPVWNPADVVRMKSALREVLTEFAHEHWAKFVSGPNVIYATHTKPKAIGPKLSTVVEPFLKEKRDSSSRKAWTMQTAAQARATFRLFEEFRGDRPVGEYERTDVNAFREGLRSLPASFGKGAPISARDAIAAADEADAESQRRHAASGQTLELTLVRRLSEKTIKRHFSALSQLWRFLKQRGDVSENIFNGWDFWEGDPDENQRSPWFAPHLETLLRSEAWTASPPDSPEHWLPLIALHAGLRIEEIATLRVPQDIGHQDDIAFFNIRPHVAQKKGQRDPVLGNFKPKSPAGTRRVPIHPWLLSHGLLKLVAYREALGDPLLFPTLMPSGPDGKLSAAFSRSFSRFKSGLGIPPAVTFHSFRTTFRTNIAQQLVPDQALDALTGHESPLPPRLVDAVTGKAAAGRGVGAKYERPALFSLKVLQEIVAGFAPPLPLDFIKPVGRSLTTLTDKTLAKRAKGDGR